MAEQQTKAAKKVDDTLPADAVVVNREVLEPKKYLFRVLGTGGFHEEDEPVRDKDDRPVLVPVLGPDNRPAFETGEDGKRRRVLRVQTKGVKYGPRREEGDVCHSNQELDVKYNVPNFPKRFERLDGKGSPETEALAEHRRALLRAAEDKQRMLRMMTVQQLREYAESAGIPLKPNINKREDVLTVIETEEAAKVHQLVAA